ncbi:MAG: J domain-containing protein [Candidatus Doudnabacteria bacterium]|nr:J domain-containing protein [Candidatus Doudnabacteria bacterium]
MINTINISYMVNRSRFEGGSHDSEHRSIETETDPYKILGVSRNTSLKELRQAYLQLIKQYHPDINSHSSAEEISKKINDAYDTLTSNINTSEGGLDDDENDEIFQSAQETQDFYTAKDEILEAASKNDLESIKKIIENFNIKYSQNINYKKGVTLGAEFYIPFSHENEKYKVRVWIHGHLMRIEDVQRLINGRKQQNQKREQEINELNPDLLISQVQSYRELYSALHKIIRVVGPIHDRDQSYTSGQMVKLIWMVRSNPEELDTIPEIFGIRNKVQELINTGAEK